jgi:hypothetical protein
MVWLTFKEVRWICRAATADGQGLGELEDAGTVEVDGADLEGFGVDELDVDVGVEEGRLVRVIAWSTPELCARRVIVYSAALTFRSCQSSLDLLARCLQSDQRVVAVWSLLGHTEW